MILIWLGSLAFLFYGLFLFRSAVASLGSSLQMSFLNLPEKGTSIFKMLMVTKLCAFSQGSFLQNQYSAVALLNTRSFSKLYAVLLLCLSGVGLWTTLFVSLMAWQVEGFWFVGIAILFYLTQIWFNKGAHAFKFFLGLGFAIVGAATLLRNQTILVSLLGESELHFLLADGRFLAQLIWLVVAFLVTLAIRFESWSVFFSMALLASGTLSLNGAVAFVVGELLAHVWILFWRSRKLNQETKHITQTYATMSSLGLLAGFILAGLLRTAYAWGFEFGTNELVNKTWQFLTMYVAVIVSQTAFVMAWGHFAARKTLDEVQTGIYFSTTWVRQGLLPRKVFELVVNKLRQRLNELTTQNKNLNESEKSQIPAAFLRTHENEIKQISSWIGEAEESRLV